MLLAHLASFVRRSRKVVKLEHYERIRRMVLVEGLSQREVARRLGHSRNTVRKALQGRKESVLRS